MAQIICRDLSFAYDGETVLSDINFSLDAGAYLCIVGENGSGKSTLMRGLLGLKTPSTGTITFNDLKPTEIGYLPQQTQIQRDFPASVREVVLSGRLNSMHGRLFYNAADKAAAITTGTARYNGATFTAAAIASAPKPTCDRPSPIME